MEKPVLVNLHCHSIFSDGALSPEQLASLLASASVRFAALTDHDTVEGLPAFEAALKKHDVVTFPGVELTTRCNEREIHILGYGFNPQNPALLATLLSLRQAQNSNLHSIADSVRRSGSSSAPASLSAAPNGTLDIETAIDLIHQAGGKAFLAHPLLYETDLNRLESLLTILMQSGLDGIEAFYTPFSPEEQRALHHLALKLNLLVCGGSDFHHCSRPECLLPASIPRPDWTRFRTAVFSSSTPEEAIPEENAEAAILTRDRHNPEKRSPFQRLRPFILRILLPTLLAVILFLAAIWGYLLPAFEQTLLDRKRELIRELTRSAWSILESYELERAAGTRTLQDAQAQAALRIEAIRYGPENKDYFWIQDTSPSMIMHPYRPDLNGKDLSNITDPMGTPVFVEFSELVEQDQEGYIDYVWQWKDDPNRIAPKESYVMGFEAWDWIIGTGIYIDDVHQEIARIRQGLTYVSMIISGAVVILLTFVLKESLHLERQRQEVVDALRESTSRYRTLVEASAEGTLLILDGRCRYANQTFLRMTGYSVQELGCLEIEDILPSSSSNIPIWQTLQSSVSDEAQCLQLIEGHLNTPSGDLACCLTLTPIQIAQQKGIILLARDTPPDAGSNPQGLSPELEAVPGGLFLARPAQQAPFVEINSDARRMLSHLTDSSAAQHGLADLFPDHASFSKWMAELERSGSMDPHVLTIAQPDGCSRSLSLSAKLMRGKSRQKDVIVGLLEDVTEAQKTSDEQDRLIRELQSSLLFLHQPLSNIQGSLAACQLNTPIFMLALSMSAQDTTAAVVQDAEGKPIGIVTDHDLRERVLAASMDPSEPVRKIMSAPIIRVPGTARIYEALLQMEEEGIRHLAVENHAGEITSILNSQALIQFQRYGPIILEREIRQSDSTAEIAQACSRRSTLVKALLDSSSRPRFVTGMLASTADAAASRLVELALAESGSPPSSFAFVAMGSQGRREQTLLADQDNGIIFAEDGLNDRNQAAEYFLALGKHVNEGLREAGFPFCPGGVMAQNNRWCRSLSEWMADVDALIHRSEPQELMNLSIFFDFRTVYGDPELAASLRVHVHKTLAAKPAFFPLLARQALHFKPPIRLPGNIYLGSRMEPGVEINLKDALMPIVGFARLYALSEGLNQTHTLERLEALSRCNILKQDALENTSAAYNFLMQLRLGIQLDALEHNHPLHNSIHPGKLHAAQHDLLRQAFTQISALQKKISYDFLGGYS